MTVAPPAVPRRDAGFALMEVILSIGVLVVILAGIGAAALSGKEALGMISSVSSVETEARRTLDRLVKEMVSTSASVLTPSPAPPFSTSSLTFQGAIGFDAGNVVWGTPTRLEFQYEPGETDNGLDDNGNGLIDEGRLVFIEDVGGPGERDVAWCHSVREMLEGEVQNGLDDNGNGLIDEPGLAFSVSDGTLRIFLTLERRDHQGRLVTRSVETGVTLRN